MALVLAASPISSRSESCHTKGACRELESRDKAVGECCSGRHAGGRMRCLVHPGDRRCVVVDSTPGCHACTCYDVRVQISTLPPPPHGPSLHHHTTVTAHSHACPGNSCVIRIVRRKLRRSYDYPRHRMLLRQPSSLAPVQALRRANRTVARSNRSRVTRRPDSASRLNAAASSAVK